MLENDLQKLKVMVLKDIKSNPDTSLMQNSPYQPTPISDIQIEDLHLREEPHPIAQLLAKHFRRYSPRIVGRVGLSPVHYLEGAGIYLWSSMSGLTLSITLRGFNHD